MVLSRPGPSLPSDTPFGIDWPPGARTERRPFTVLYICAANICRSAYAECRSRGLVGGDGPARFASAGTDGLTPQPMDGPMAAELVARGGDPSGLFGARFTPQGHTAADLVLTMTVPQRTRLLDEVPQAHARVFTLGQFTRAVASAGRRLGPADLVSWVALRRPPADPADDVPDPYGQGQEAARRTADIIDQHLLRLLPRLS